MLEYLGLRDFGFLELKFPWELRRWRGAFPLLTTRDRAYWFTGSRGEYGAHIVISLAAASEGLYFVTKEGLVYRGETCLRFPEPIVTVVAELQMVAFLGRSGRLYYQTQMITAPTPIISCAVGARHLLYLTLEGQAYGLGASDAWQLGLHAAQSKVARIASGVTRIFAQAASSYFLTEEDILLGLGVNIGRLGNRTLFTTPTMVWVGRIRAIGYNPHQLLVLSKSGLYELSFGTTTWRGTLQKYSDLHRHSAVTRAGVVVSLT